MTKSILKKKEKSPSVKHFSLLGLRDLLANINKLCNKELAKI